MEIEVTAYDEEKNVVTYKTSFDTVAGNISFKNEAFFQKGENGYELMWDDSLIFPELRITDKVNVSVTQAKRGEILDRNGRVLAGTGMASSVGIVPKKLENQVELPFEIQMAKSQYSNTESIETEIQLADSGYGQGQVLVNPQHMACIYSAFCNDGSMIKSYLWYQKEAAIQHWIPEAFSKETVSQVLEGTQKVVNDSNGTGYAAHREDVKERGGSGYVIKKII